MKRIPLALVVFLTASITSTLQAADAYWDSNDVTPGAGVTPTGVWGTDSFWSSDASGSTATAAWTSGDNAIFSAGTDATGSYVVTVSGTQTVGALTIEEGNVTFATGFVNTGAGSITVNAGAVLTTDISGRFTTTAGSKVTLNGGTLRTTNTGNAGTFFDTDSEIILGSAGGIFSYTTPNVLNIVQTATKITGTGSLTKDGVGVLAVATTAGNNTYSGGTIINDGELRMRTIVNTLPITTAVTVNNPGIFNLNGVATQIGSLTGAGTVGLANGTLTVGDATNTSFTGVIKDTANAGAGGSTSTGGSITKVGAGTLTLTGLNAHTGTTTVSAGTLTVSSGATLSGSTASLIVNGGTLNLNNTAQTVKNLSSTTALGTINLAAGHTLTVDPILSTVYSGTIAGAGGLTKLNVLSGATNRTLTLSGANTYDGNTIVSGGNIAVASPTALGSTVGYTEVSSGAEVVFTGAATNFTVAEPLRVAGSGNTDSAAIAVIASATPTLSGPVTLTGDATLTVSSTSTVVFSNANSITSLANQNLTLQGGSGVGGGGTISGIITLGTGSLTKLQGGKWTLGGNNAYTGATTISAGTLALTGSISNTSSIDVQSGATFDVSAVSGGFLLGSAQQLKGNGLVAGPVTVAGNISPGASPGTLTFNSSLTLASAAVLTMELAGPLAGQYDKLAGMNGLTLDGVINVSLISGYNPAFGDTFDLLDWTGTLNSTGFNVATDLTLPALTGANTWDTSNFTANGSITVVPEPAAAGLLALVSLAAFRRRRRTA